MILRREHPELLAKAKIELRLMDLNSDGTDFAARSLHALAADGCPLSGIDIRLRVYRYDWNNPAELRTILEDVHVVRDGVVVSSEGGLFEYASDAAIRDTLRIFRTITPLGSVFVGSVGKAGKNEKAIHKATATSAVPRPLDSFRELVDTAGWRTLNVLECPLCHCVSLTPKSEE